MSETQISIGGWLPAIRPLPADEAVAAVGDVHGHDALLATLGDALEGEMAGAARRRVVLLGDLVDRGPASLQTLRRARAGIAGAETVTIMGNHEDRMLRALDGDVAEEAAWLGFGGEETLASAGCSGADRDWRARFRDALGEDLLAWIRGLPPLHRIGPLVFAHAGLDPDAPLDRQQPRTLMWTRRPWLDSPGPYPQDVAVLHGHTPRLPVDLSHPHRVNLDTGAFRTGLLSALLIRGDRMRLVQAARPA